MPRCLGASASVRASMNIQSARWAPEVQIFWPLTTYSSPSRTARVWSEARSEPEPGSLKPWHQTASPRRILGRCCAFCSSLPWTMRVGPTIWTPMPPTWGAPASANSSFMMNCSMVVRPAPPYSVGQPGAIQPRSASFWRHSPKSPPSRRKLAPPARASGRPSTSSGGTPPSPTLRRLRRRRRAGSSLSRNWRTSSRQAASPGVSFSFISSPLPQASPILLTRGAASTSNAQALGDQLAVVIGVAPGQLRRLLAPEVELDLVVLGEADAAVHLLGGGDDATARLAHPRLGDMHLLVDVGLFLGDGPRRLVGDVAGGVDVGRGVGRP